MKYKRQIAFAKERIREIDYTLNYTYPTKKREAYLRSERINHRTFLDICKCEKEIERYEIEVKRVKKLVNILHKTQLKKKCSLICKLVPFIKKY
jgi:hypothetical protein